MSGVNDGRVKFTWSVIRMPSTLVSFEPAFFSWVFLVSELGWTPNPTLFFYSRLGDIVKFLIGNVI